MAAKMLCGTRAKAKHTPAPKTKYAINFAIVIMSNLKKIRIKSLR
jgi:hypothetical protein